MSVQTKILILLLAIVATLIGGFTALHVFEARKFRALAESRERERNRDFDEFLVERGDKLKVLVDDSSVWSDMVLAVMKGDTNWATTNLSDETLATYNVNAIWIYKPDQTLFYSRNNRYADNLRELPLPKDAFSTLFAKDRTCHFFLQVPQGWMEIRGATIHPSLDRSRETLPQGYFFAGHIWIDDNIRRMSLFTGYDIHIEPLGVDAPTLDSTEDTGLITFSRSLPGWTGQPTAKIVITNDSPIIRELNRASHRLFIYLLIFAAGLLVILSYSLNVWIRRPLRHLTRSLHTGNLALLAPVQKGRDEFARLANLIAEHRRTENALIEAEDRLRHAQKLEAVGRLAGGVAHDFNNLLTAIMGYSELLEAKLERDAPSREFARQIRITGEKAAALTKQLLAFSRRQLLTPKVLNLNVVVSDLEKLLQRVIGEHIRIHIQISAEEARVRADPGQLDQVILNLGVNARDAMPQGGTLTIATEVRSQLDFPPDSGFSPSTSGYVFLIVSDTGCGMDGATKDRIFEPFFTTKGPGKGTGLGLATVYGIVKQSGGGIHVESELSKGSKFVIYLPRENAPVDTPLPAPLELIAQANAETILVVEDEEVVRQLICTVLKDVGYHVLCASSPSEALQLAAKHIGRIELVVTDIVMPEMHGPTLARQLLALRPDLGVLYVSGYSENDISDQGVIDPGLDVLQKPFSKLSLVRKVREMLDSAGTRTAH